MTDQSNKSADHINFENSTIRIREMTFDDLDEVSAIENLNFGSEAWSSTGFLTYLLRDDTLFLVAERIQTAEVKSGSSEENVSSILGYTGLLMAPYEADLITICVRESARRQGVAAALLDQVVKRSLKFGVTMLHLEVRTRNTAALAFYNKSGFVQTGLRKEYYVDPKDDAVTMTWGKKPEN